MPVEVGAGRGQATDKPRDPPHDRRADAGVRGARGADGPSGFQYGTGFARRFATVSWGGDGSRADEQHGDGHALEHGGTTGLDGDKLKTRRDGARPAGQTDERGAVQAPRRRCLHQPGPRRDGRTEQRRRHPLAERRKPLDAPTADHRHADADMPAVGELEDPRNSGVPPTTRCCGAGGIVRPTACACARQRQGASLRSAPAAAGLTALTPAPRTPVQTDSCPTMPKF